MKGENLVAFSQTGEELSFIQTDESLLGISCQLSKVPYRR